MLIAVERNIPFIKGLLEPYAEVRYLAADEFTPQTVRDADALVVRTRTRCDATLLDGSRCRLVATATIGTDHIDIDYCRSHNISVANAPGCNAPAVAQYVFASLLSLTNRPLSQYTIGIVGVGHVGKIVERWAHAMDMEVLVNDPPRLEAEGDFTANPVAIGKHSVYASLSDIASQADIITLHTPLEDSTRHLVDDRFVESLRRSPIIINAARGPITDTEALIRGLESGRIHHTVIDCWEDEPAISPILLSMSTVATPHIAGYSYEGKVRATRMVLNALSDKLGLPHIEMEQTVAMEAPPRVRPAAIAASYDPMVDTRALRANPTDFEKLRNTYHLRNEVAWR